MHKNLEKRYVSWVMAKILLWCHTLENVLGKTLLDIGSKFGADTSEVILICLLI